MMIQRFVFALACLIYFAHPAVAQIMSDTERSAMLLANRMIWAQAIINRDVETGLRSNPEWTYQWWDASWNAQILAVRGWAVSCEPGANGYTKAMDIVVDQRIVWSTDAIAAPPGYRSGVLWLGDRQDVRTIVSSWGGNWSSCVPQYPELEVWVDITRLAKGWHAVQFRTWDTTTARSDLSPSRAFYRE